MGVSGSGKTEVGTRVAAHFGARFVDADALHPAANIEKMSRAVPLTDEDRWPWLHRLKEELQIPNQGGEVSMAACSSLKRSYRDFLRDGFDGMQFVYLKGSFDLILSRISARKGHFMKSDLLKSQFATLEEPDEREPGIIIVPVDGTLEEVVNLAVHALQGSGEIPSPVGVSNETKAAATA